MEGKREKGKGKREKGFPFPFSLFPFPFSPGYHPDCGRPGATRRALR
jgi:hypothetical protein